MSNAARKEIIIPRRGPIESLESKGARILGDAASFGNMRLDVPAHWQIEATSVSPFHHHLVDGKGHCIACLFSKPGSGGTGSFQISSADNCAELAQG